MGARDLLDEMLARDGWMDPFSTQGAEWECSKLQELKLCVINEDDEAVIAAIPKRMCAYEFKPGDIAWNCKVCQADETCVMCNDCFIASDHENHEVFFYYTQSGGCCDCGDMEAWSPAGFCPNHKGNQATDTINSIPIEILEKSRATLHEIVEFVTSTIVEARSISILTAEDLNHAQLRLSTTDEETRFSVIVHYNELLLDHEFGAALKKAQHDRVYLIMKAMQDLRQQKQSIVRSRCSKEEALEAVKSLIACDLSSSIVSCDYQSALPVVNSLLQWLAYLAGRSDCLCRIICEQFFVQHSNDTLINNSKGTLDKNIPSPYPLLSDVILADSFLPLKEREALHSLHMALLADPNFKKAFAVAFTVAYRQLYREFVAGIGSSNVEILTFGVQFFNRISFVQLLVKEYDLLQVLITTMQDTLRKRHRNRRTEIWFDNTWTSLLPLLRRQNTFIKLESTIFIHRWDVQALAIQSCSESTVGSVRVNEWLQESTQYGHIVNYNSPIYLLPGSTELPGRYELDLDSRVFKCRRYISGVYDLKYALQIEGISSIFVKDDKHLLQLLLYLAYAQGVCSESYKTRESSLVVEREKRGWIAAVEFVSATTELFMWIVINIFKQKAGIESPVALEQNDEQKIVQIIQRIFDVFYFWIASCDRYFPPLSFNPGDLLPEHVLEQEISCHYPIQRALSQVLRAILGFLPREIVLDNMMQMLEESSSPISTGTLIWVHGIQTPIGFWHRTQLLEPVLQSIAWDAGAHAGLYTHCSKSAVNHSINYGEPPFCLRFRDLDLLLLQYGFRLVSIDWLVISIIDRFGISSWTKYGVEQIEDENAENGALPGLVERMVVECLSLFCQIATECPPRELEVEPVTSLLPLVRRELVQRLCVGPCAHSDLAKIFNDFITMYDHVMPNNFTPAAILDGMLDELCVAPKIVDGKKHRGTSFNLRPELLMEYDSTSIHLTRLQHECAHENWTRERVRMSKLRTQHDTSLATSWQGFAAVKPLLPCAFTYRFARLAILHPNICSMLYRIFYRAATDTQISISLLSKAVHLFTLQLYVVEDIRHYHTAEESRGDQSRLEQAYSVTSKECIDYYLNFLSNERPVLGSTISVIKLLLNLDPWKSSKSRLLEGDVKHEIGRSIDWIVHRIGEFSDKYAQIIQERPQVVDNKTDIGERKQAFDLRRKQAQAQALERMRQKQADFNSLMLQHENEKNGEGDEELVVSASTTEGATADVNIEDSRDLPTTSLPECAMCHLAVVENSFMCYLGFAQSSAILTRSSGSTDEGIATPIDEIHSGEDVPVHARLCGHAVHHVCWLSYHASQFQRAITGGYQRSGLTTVDPTKHEFLCPLCKTISNVLIPSPECWKSYTDKNMCDHSINDGDVDMEKNTDTCTTSVGNLLEWLEGVIDSTDDMEIDSTSDSNFDDDSSKNERQSLHNHDNLNIQWAEIGLASLCMGIHRVACGSMQKSYPQKYISSACCALYHTLISTLIPKASTKDIIGEERFLQAMIKIPQMLTHLKLPSTQLSQRKLKVQVAKFLYYGGADILSDGTVVLEEEPPNTQTQTRKQSLWGKVRWPTKPLLLCHLGGILMKGMLFSETWEEALQFARLLLLARVVQSLAWYSINRCQKYAEHLTKEEEFQFVKDLPCFIDVFGGRDETEDEVADVLENFRQILLDDCADSFPQVRDMSDKKKLLQLVCFEVMPMVRVATYTLLSLNNIKEEIASPQLITSSHILQQGFLTFKELLLPCDFDSDQHSLSILEIAKRWVKRFILAYSDMQDPHEILPQWLSSAHKDHPNMNITIPELLSRDLHSMHSMLSVAVSGSCRTRYIRSLPKTYVKFYAALAKRKCKSCNQFPSRPAVCLICGTLLCAANTCPSTRATKGTYEEVNPGACTLHAKKCGRGSGIFLLILEGAVLLVYSRLAAYVGSVYVDEYGEEFGERNRELNRGRPLYLDEERRDRLLEMWVGHEIPKEVVRIQNSSDRVIRNNHY